MSAEGKTDSKTKLIEGLAKFFSKDSVEGLKTSSKQSSQCVEVELSYGYYCGGDISVGGGEPISRVDWKHAKG